MKRRKTLSLSDNTKSRPFRIALLGNPNSGKSSLFNVLTGLRQKISNYPGVTVDKKSGYITLDDGQEIELIDFPGIYSLYPNSSDEKIVVEILTNPEDSNYPDGILYVAASLELEKHFLLATQVKELRLPMLFSLTMADIARRKGFSCDTRKISEYLDAPVLEVSSLTGENIELLKRELSKMTRVTSIDEWTNGYKRSPLEESVEREIAKESGIECPYQNLLLAHHHSWLGHLTAAQRINLNAIVGESNFDSIKQQITETLSRYNDFTPLIRQVTRSTGKDPISKTEYLDNILTHKVAGPVIFFLLMFLVFQAIYSWAELPMLWIENLFASAGVWVQKTFPAGWLTDLTSDGILAGLGGIMVFIPQIAILFLLISVLEEVGYMSRAVFMFDNIMQRFGMNGRSLVALISGGACAIPAIMSTRTIANWKERLTTIMVTPLISCSARIPVYTVLIAFAVPKMTVAGIFNTQGLAFMGLYLLGIGAALISGWVIKILLKSDEQSYLMIELPPYKRPLWNNVIITVKERTGAFIIEAGKIIFLVSIVLWFLASYGPKSAMERAAVETEYIAEQRGMDEAEKENLMASSKLEASYAGQLGKTIEPVIKPLGFDWKMGIALITSFAAREVFVGTMATIYSVGSTEDELTIREKMAEEINPDTGGKRYDIATSLSLLLFYVFALQCMSTLAITKRETKSWKWPLIQFTFMGVMAYLSSLAAYQILI